MKTLMTLSICTMLLSACQKSDTTSSGPTKQPVDFTYAGTPEIGKPENLLTVLEWNTQLSKLDTDIGHLLADTVSLHLYDGFEKTMTRDSAVALVKSYIGDLSSITITYNAAVPLDNTTKNDEWVMLWTTEKYIRKDGTEETHHLHEDYRVVHNKIREVFQYERKVPGK